MWLKPHKHSTGSRQGWMTGNQPHYVIKGKGVRELGRIQLCKVTPCELERRRP